MVEPWSCCLRRKINEIVAHNDELMCPSSKFPDPNSSESLSRVHGVARVDDLSAVDMGKRKSTFLAAESEPILTEMHLNKTYSAKFCRAPADSAILPAIVPFCQQH